jgi:hypothetical protein
MRRERLRNADKGVRSFSKKFAGPDGEAKWLPSDHTRLKILLLLEEVMEESKERAGKFGHIK